jgi:hypothetical protein
MQFTTSVILLLTSTLTVAAPLKVRDASTILTDISNISSDVASLDTDVKAFDGSIISALGLISSVNNVKSSLTSGASDAGSSAAFSDVDSASIVSALQTLVPAVTGVLTDLDAKVRFRIKLTYFH